MSVTEKPLTAPVHQDPHQQLLVGSVLGAVVVLAALGIVFAGLPWLWWEAWNTLFANNDDMRRNTFLSRALLILVDLLAMGGLAYGAHGALQRISQPGLRAGIFFQAVVFCVAGGVSFWIGAAMEGNEQSATVGWSVMAVVAGAAIAGAAYLYLKSPAWLNFLETLEQQGWFHGISYKGNQGVRVRRGSIIGLLAVGLCGIITLSMNRFFGVERPDLPSNDWFLDIPFTEQTKFIPLFYSVHLIIPLVLGVALMWVAWRVVNVPAFADFLIATEAEMNKVSWTNRRRLYQDSIVVLVTTFLMTAFLFAVDIVWIRVLSAPGIQVLVIDLKEAEKQQQKTAEW
ncbi:MAG: preprotein translocase subunit SecE [Planctomycetes bacterium]|nr:preprotein translocase subunit SecE [Planctomycetota bacterium]